MSSTDKIRVVHHSKTVGFSGTDRTAQLFCKYLAKGEKYEPFLVYREGDSANSRLDIARQWLGEDHVIPYRWIPGKKGKIPPYIPEEDNFFDVLKQINPAIVHNHASGYNEFPILKYLCPTAKLVTTNIFGFNDATKQADLVLYISQYVEGIARGQQNFTEGGMLYNPIEQPVLDMTFENKELCREELLARLKIPHNAVLIGRVGRADNFDPISLKAFQEVEKACPEAFYIVVNPCGQWRETAQKLGIQNIRFVDPIINDTELSKFYMGLDLYAHARSDGEMCPCNIQEAMMHGIPVISHESAIYNGQSEILAESGFVVPIGDWQSYRDVMIQLVQNPQMVNENETGVVRLRAHFGREGRRRALRHFEASCVTSSLERIYDWLLSK